MSDILQVEILSWILSLIYRFTYKIYWYIYIYCDIVNNSTFILGFFYARRWWKYSQHSSN